MLKGTLLIITALFVFAHSTEAAGYRLVISIRLADTALGAESSHVKNTALPKEQSGISVPPSKGGASQATDKEIAEYIKSKDWPYEDAIRIAKSENYWNLTKSFDCARTHVNKNGSTDVGIFMINSIHEKRLKKLGMTMEDMKDCKKNIDYAYEWLYKYQGWNPWYAYLNGSYLSHSIVKLWRAY